MLNTNHTFAICAYKESPYLEECIRSILDQSEKTNVILSTSTDNSFIRGLAEKYNLPLYINPGKGDIQDNWNFAFSQTQTQFVTIAHQDDYYHPDYAKYVLRAIRTRKNIIFLHTHYFDVVDGVIQKSNMNRRIKTFLNFPLRFRFFAGNRFFRRLALSFGNTICCPSVTYNRQAVDEPPFHSDLSMAMDWELFYDMSQKKGTCVFVKNPLTFKRLHEASGTNEMIQNGARYQDDIYMFSRLWPRPVALCIAKFYKKSYDVNNFG